VYGAIAADIAAGPYRLAAPSTDGDWLDFEQLAREAAAAMARRRLELDVEALLDGVNEPGVEVTLILASRKQGVTAPRSGDSDEWREAIGFLICSTSKEIWGESACWIEGLYLRPGNRAAIPMLKDFIIREAEERGQKRILWASPLKGMMRWSLGVGAKPKGIIYELGVFGGREGSAAQSRGNARREARDGRRQGF